MSSPVIAYRPELLTPDDVQRWLDRLRDDLDAATKAASGLSRGSSREEIVAAHRALSSAAGDLHWLVRGRLPGEH